MERTDDKIQVQEHKIEDINILKKICPLLKLLSHELIAKLYMIQICGKSLNGILIMTTDLMMYGLGNNENGQLGIGYIDATTYPIKIDALCGKKIKKLIYLDKPVVFALTEEGQIYSWGSNANSILGLGEKAPSTVYAPNLIFNLIEKCIVDIASDGSHAAALTECGKIYLWGVLYYKCYDQYNYNYNYETHIVSVPEVFWNDEFGYIKHICCGKDFTIALTDKGVYGSGKNNKLQLGISNDPREHSKPDFIQLFSNNKIVKIVCGCSHVIALDDEGKLYVWGSNEYGQLGMKSPKETICTMLDEHKMGKIVNIAALSHRDISVALNDEGRIYVWGYYDDLHLSTPMEIAISDMYDVFEGNLPYVICASTLTYSDNYKDIVDILKNIETAFDDSSLSDLTIRVKGQSIYVHKFILNIRSEYFRNMFQQTEWKESNQSVIEYDQFSYDVFKSFLKYLYTKKIDLPVDRMLELLILADTYKETDLKNHCIQILQKDSDNFVTMVLNAIRKN